MGWNYTSIPQFKRCNSWNLSMDKLFHPTLYMTCDYLSMLGLKLIHISKGYPGNRKLIVIGVTVEVMGETTGTWPPRKNVYTILTVIYTLIVGNRCSTYCDVGDVVIEPVLFTWNTAMPWVNIISYKLHYWDKKESRLRLWNMKVESAECKIILA